METFSREEEMENLRTVGSSIYSLRMFNFVTSGDDLYNSLSGERQVWNLAPFTDKHFRIRNLGDTIKDLQNLVFLYPNVPKAQCFGKFWTLSQGEGFHSAIRFSRKKIWFFFLTRALVY